MEKKYNEEVVFMQSISFISAFLMLMVASVLTVDLINSRDIKMKFIESGYEQRVVQHKQGDSMDTTVIWVKPETMMDAIIIAPEVLVEPSSDRF